MTSRCIIQTNGQENWFLPIRGCLASYLHETSIADSSVTIAAAVGLTQNVIVDHVCQHISSAPAGTPLS